MMFETPIVVFLFRRHDTLERIFQRIRAVKPSRLYLIADGPRNESERASTQKVRDLAESYIDWECDVVKRYASDNIGVYCNIGEGAKWVFTQEKRAIFLEDDNLPQVTFFQYCEEMLDRYENLEKVLWVCGTNYLEKYKNSKGEDYMFTQHLLPCGWASWSEKFSRYYDGELVGFSKDGFKKLKGSYVSAALYRQDLDVLGKTKSLLANSPKKASWDRQMIYSLKYNNLVGISPSTNQIKNIGADELSTHGGTSLNKTMTARFCEIPSASLVFPLKHPDSVKIDQVYEAKIAKIILLPASNRYILNVFRFFKPLFGLKKNESFVLKYGYLWRRN